jgi:hypothetical protein
MVIDPANPSTLYLAGVGGVFKSTDSGVSWRTIRAGISDPNLHCLAIDPSRPNILYAGTSIGGLFMSSDGGEKWQLANDNLLPFLIWTLAVDPVNPNLVYVGTFGGSVYKREFRFPEISSAVFAAPKKLTISGRNFGNAPRVIINGLDRSDFLVDSSDTAIQLKGKAKKLKLKSGDNTIQVIRADATESQVFILKL